MKHIRGIRVPTVSIAQVVSVGLGECAITMDGMTSTISANFTAKNLNVGDKVYAVKCRTHTGFFVHGESIRTNEYPIVGEVLENLSYLRGSIWDKVRSFALFDTDQNDKSLIAISRSEEYLENVKESLKNYGLAAREIARYHRKHPGMVGSEYELSRGLASIINGPVFDSNRRTLFVPIPTVSISKLEPGHIGMLEYCVEKPILPEVLHT